MPEIISNSWQLIFIATLVVSVFTYITRHSSESLIKKIKHWKPSTTFFLVILFLGGPLTVGACALAVYRKYKKMTPPEKERFKEAWQQHSSKNFTPEEAKKFKAKWEQFLMKDKIRGKSKKISFQKNFTTGETQTTFTQSTTPHRPIPHKNPAQQKSFIASLKRGAIIILLLVLSVALYFGINMWKESQTNIPEVNTLL